MGKERRMSAGAIEKDHHLARNGASLSHLDKKGGAGKYNWGDVMAQVDEVEDQDEIDNDEKLFNDRLSKPFVPQPKVGVASSKEFNEMKAGYGF
ncbi:hypothetical protein LPJ78_002957 [Coemansia sp. RSA 989]|nr:hypothetical protein LPJ78_002957 [Coemansia sp. RSA 989]KAJ1872423.1 hypothetical protein LPJ55_003117 [Coemansia sp. RSA 990]KAJ2627060.1 hypothetical protein H4R22_004563 [Coemansia sp. RSA 1290]KAJ2652730.1 hypothetical protein IWW40_000841 [Coemansia sp. RSA 1250]